MDPRPKFLIVLSAVLGALVLAGCSNTPAGPAPAATAGPTQITDEQVAHEAQLFTFVGGLSQQPCGSPAAGESPEAACNRFALSNLIQSVFIKNYAQANQITVGDADVAKIVANLDQQVGADKVDQALATNSLTRDDLNVFGGEILLLQSAQRKLATSGLSDADLQKLYKEQILDFTTVQADHILVKTQAEAEKVYQQVSAPGFTDAQFSALAKDVSIDPSAKQNGGALPAQAASAFVPDFNTAVAALAPGEISKPVKTKVGWHVIKLVTKDVTPFAQAKDQLAQSGGSKVFSDWLMQQAKDQGVDVNPKYGRYDIATLSVVPITSTDPSGTPSAVASGSLPATSTPAP